MKHYRNKQNIRLTFSSVKREIFPGKVAEFNDKELEDPRCKHDIELYIKADYLEEVSKKAEDTVFATSANFTSVIVPKDIKPMEQGQVVLPQGLTQESEGQVVVAGKERMPGQGESKPMSEFVSGQVKKAGQVLEDATKDKKPPEEVKKKKKRQSPKI